MPSPKEIQSFLERLEIKFRSHRNIEMAIEKLKSEIMNKESKSDFSYDYFVYSDGACRGNPGPGSWAMICEDSENNKVFEGASAEMNTTNNRMEMKAALAGLERLTEEVGEEQALKKSVGVFSDSNLLVKGMNEWRHGWKKRGWKKSDKTAPENLELWKGLDLIVDRFHLVKFHWVKGHSGHPQNEYCDQLANKVLDELL